MAESAPRREASTNALKPRNMRDPNTPDLFGSPTINAPATDTPIPGVEESAEKSGNEAGASAGSSEDGAETPNFPDTANGNFAKPNFQLRIAPPGKPEMPVDPESPESESPPDEGED